MYKFTNGIVVFDEETKDTYIKAGFKLIEEKKEESIENNKDDRIIQTKSKTSKRIPD